MAMGWEVDDKRAVEEQNQSVQAVKERTMSESKMGNRIAVA